MSTLICMAVYDTEENGRSEYTKRALESLAVTVDWKKHKLVVVDNNSCQETKDYLNKLMAVSHTKIAGNFGTKIPGLSVIALSENVGTARAINMGIRLREGNAVVKIDNDVVIHQSGWVGEMEEVINRAPEYGIVGLKRKDLRQTPFDPDPQFRSELRQLPHEAGQRWVIVEETADIMGTCTMLSPALLDALGGYYQGDGIVYAFDDTLINLRAGLAGFKKCFLPHIDMDHVDTGANPYSAEKVQLANKAWPVYHQLHEAYISGSRSLFEKI